MLSVLNALQTKVRIVTKWATSYSLNSIYLGVRPSGVREVFNFRAITQESIRVTFLTIDKEREVEKYFSFSVIISRSAVKS